jgi:Ca-activated chloride channel family protein
LKDFIAKKRKSGVYLSVFGFGKGNINDTLMQSLAQNGNGQAAYIDTLAEAQKALVDESGGTLFPIAKDVKIQVEFDPSKIAEYRLIGYETRALKREDFNNDKVDAGDIGAGHSVTAIYELTPVGSPAVLVDPLRYGDAKPAAAENPYGEIGFLKMRYKLPTENKSKLLSTPLLMNSPAEKQDTVSQDVSFATAVAAFGQKLRANPALDDMTYAQIADMAHKAKGEDAFGYRSAFVQLVRMAESLSKSR